MRPLHQDWESWLFYLIYINQHKEPKKMKKQRYMFQTKLKDKTLETDLNETEIRDLPDKAFKIMVIVSSASGVGKVGCCM